MQRKPNRVDPLTTDLDAMRREVVLAVVRRLRMTTVREIWDDIHSIPAGDERIMVRRARGRLCPSMTRLHADLKRLRDDGLVVQHHLGKTRAVWTPID